MLIVIKRNFVMNLTALHDIEYQNSSTLVSASWHGFLELQSYIDHYIWCVGDDPADPDEAGVVSCENMGLKLQGYKQLDGSLTTGNVAFAFIYFLLLRLYDYRSYHKSKLCIVYL